MRPGHRVVKLSGTITVALTAAVLAVPAGQGGPAASAADQSGPTAPTPGAHRVAVGTGGAVASTGPGGLNYMNIYRKKEDDAVVIGNRAPAPAAFGQDDRTGLSSTGALSVGVPTAVKGWEQALERYGTISLRRDL